MSVIELSGANSDSFFKRTSHKIVCIKVLHIKHFMFWLFAIHQNEVNFNIELLTFVYPTLVGQTHWDDGAVSVPLLLVELGLHLPFVSVNYKVLTEELCKFKRACRLPCVSSLFLTFYCNELWVIP